MKPSEYRRQVEQELAEKAERRRAAGDPLDAAAPPAARRLAIAEAQPVRGERRLARADAIAGDRSQETTLRIAAVHALAPGLAKSEERMDAVIAILSDQDEPVALRRTALAALQQASFRAAPFDAKRPDYLAALRGLVDEPDDELREQALELLAIHHDEYAQRRLIEGLRDAAKALVAPEKAIQLLGHDPHAEVYPLLREMVENPPSQAAKHEAVRLLGADSGSRDLLAGIVEDGDEDPEIRSTGAVALQAVAPEEFVDRARRIVVDEGEDETLRATCLNALAHSPAGRRAERDAGFDAQVENVQLHARSTELEKAAHDYLAGAEDETPEPVP